MNIDPTRSAGITGYTAKTAGVSPDASVTVPVETVQMGQNQDPSATDLSKLSKAVFTKYADGAKSWSFKMMSGFFSPPLQSPDGKHVYSFSLKKDDKSALYILTDSGKPEKTRDMGPTASPPVMGKDGTLYLKEKGVVYALNSDGSEKWTKDFGDKKLSLLTMGKDGSVCFGCSDGNFYVLNPDGTEKWRQKADCYMNLPPVVGEGGHIVMMGNGGKLHCFNPDGSEKHTIEPKGGFRSTMTRVAVGKDGSVYESDFDGKNLYAYKPDGSDKWTQKLPENFKISFADRFAEGTDGTLYMTGNQGGFMDGAGKLLVVSPDDGSEKWSVPLEAYGETAPALDPQGNIYVGCRDQHVRIFGPDGSRQGKEKFDSVPCTPASITPEGNIYQVTSDGTVVALKTKKRFNEDVKADMEAMKTKDLEPVTSPAVEKLENEVDIDGARLQRRRKKI